MNALHQAMGCTIAPAATKAQHNCRTTFAGPNPFRKAAIDDMKTKTIDEQIAIVLTRSGIKTVIEIAEELGLTENHIYKRLCKLVDEGSVIQIKDGKRSHKFTAVASPPDVTRESVLAVIQANPGVMVGEIKKMLKKRTLQRPIADLIADCKIVRKIIRGQFRYWPCEAQ